jgi:hypothetical protein
VEPAMADMYLLPEWLRWVWAAAFLGVVVAHAWHAWSMRGQPRWWHIGHTTMAGGMLVMYLVPHMAHPGLYRAGLVLFVLVAAAEAAWTLVLRRREGWLNPLWVATTVDQLVMVYMLAMPMSGPVLVTSALVVYLGVQTVLWGAGLWSRVPAVRPQEAPLGAPGAASAPPRAREIGLAAEADVVVRISLAVMAAGMGYMLLTSVG